jgi:hypothetical protein
VKTTTAHENLIHTQSNHSIMNLPVITCIYGKQPSVNIRVVQRITYNIWHISSPALRDGRLVDRAERRKNNTAMMGVLLRQPRNSIKSSQNVYLEFFFVDLFIKIIIIGEKIANTDHGSPCTFPT